jgi:hypothetical protein
MPILLWVQGYGRRRGLQAITGPPDPSGFGPVGTRRCGHPIQPEERPIPDTPSRDPGRAPHAKTTTGTDRVDSLRGQRRPPAIPTLSWIPRSGAVFSTTTFAGPSLPEGCGPRMRPTTASPGSTRMRSCRIWNAWATPGLLFKARTSPADMNFTACWPGPDARHCAPPSGCRC